MPQTTRWLATAVAYSFCFTAFAHHEDDITPVVSRACTAFYSAAETQDHEAAIDALMAIPPDAVQTPADRLALVELFDAIWAGLEQHPEFSQLFTARVNADPASFDQFSALLMARLGELPSLVGTTPEYELHMLDGSTVTEQSFRGELVLLDFWSTWCTPCIASMPHMFELAEQYPHIQMIGISIDEDRQLLEDWVASNETPWPVAHSTGRIHSHATTDLARQFQAYGIPHIIIIAPNGEILWTGHPVDVDEPLAQAVAEYSS